MGQDSKQATIADQHGALLSLKSQPGAGACFEVKFPPVKVQTK